ncbi:DDE-type integrase/transposase/recombinase [Streptomyces sp. NPDC096012]|uniref:DDE-type integrase/transposase/recombinase n=1 Tax=Streptomyces sp. NPDC096012 TaxID=3155684 RepID=UPI00336A85E8
MADFTYVATWSRIVYVAFVVDVFSRAIVDWSAATSKRAKLVLDALDMALWRRDRAGIPAGTGLIHHSDAGSQYTSFAFTAHLLKAGIDASIGTVGDALDNALMESQIGLHKTEFMKPRRPWHGLANVELDTTEWVDWFNNQRLHTTIADIPPHEHETNYYAQPSLNRRLESMYRASTDPGAVYSAPAIAVAARMTWLFPHSCQQQASTTRQSNHQVTEAAPLALR